MKYGDLKKFLVTRYNRKRKKKSVDNDVGTYCKIDDVVTTNGKRLSKIDKNVDSGNNNNDTMYNNNIDMSTTTTTTLLNSETKDYENININNNNNKINNTNNDNKINNNNINKKNNNENDSNDDNNVNSSKDPSKRTRKNNSLRYVNSFA